MVQFSNVHFQHNINTVNKNLASGDKNAIDQGKILLSNLQNTLDKLSESMKETAGPSYDSSTPFMQGVADSVILNKHNISFSELSTFNDTLRELRKTAESAVETPEQQFVMKVTDQLSGDTPPSVKGVEGAFGGMLSAYDVLSPPETPAGVIRPTLIAEKALHSKINQLESDIEGMKALTPEFSLKQLGDQKARFNELRRMVVHGSTKDNIDISQEQSDILIARIDSHLSGIQGKLDGLQEGLESQFKTIEEELSFNISLLSGNKMNEKGISRTEMLISEDLGKLKGVNIDTLMSLIDNSSQPFSKDPEQVSQMRDLLSRLLEENILSQGPTQPLEL